METTLPILFKENGETIALLAGGCFVMTKNPLSQAASDSYLPQAIRDFRYHILEFYDVSHDYLQEWAKALEAQSSDIAIMHIGNEE